MSSTIFIVEVDYRLLKGSWLHRTNRGTPWRGSTGPTETVGTYVWGVVVNLLRAETGRVRWNRQVAGQEIAGVCVFSGVLCLQQKTTCSRRRTRECIC